MESIGHSVPVIDLFAGPGGLGEGFSRCPHDGLPRFRTGLSIEMEDWAHETLRLRSFYRQFRYDGKEVHEDYYRLMRYEITLEKLYELHPDRFQRADKEARQAKLGETDPLVVDSWIKNALGDAKNWVLLGGPPCQAYSLIGRSRNKGVEDYSFAKDEKHDLYKEYLRIISQHWPTVFVMENVKGLLSAQLDAEKILTKILADLHDPGMAVQLPAGSPRHRYRIVSLVKDSTYGEDGHKPQDFIVRSELYGVPQARHRLILMGIRDDLDGTTPQHLQESPEQIDVTTVLAGLPKLRSGLSREEDSAERWVQSLKGHLEHPRWLKGVGSRGGQKVRELIEATLNALSVPAGERGEEYMPVAADVVFDPAWWFPDVRIKGVCHHTTRSHIAKDLLRYLHAACYAKIHHKSPALKDFPGDLLPNHKNAKTALSGSNFADRFRVQVEGRPSTTVTSHISKDGHYYIHYDPAQCRSLTVREAARLQTFPDNYFFCGKRTAQYTQVGNAVPPYLAWQIAEVVYDVLKQAGMTGVENGQLIQRAPKLEHEPYSWREHKAGDPCAVATPSHGLPVPVAP